MMLAIENDDDRNENKRPTVATTAKCQSSLMLETIHIEVARYPCVIVDLSSVRHLTILILHCIVLVPLSARTEVESTFQKAAGQTLNPFRMQTCSFDRNGTEGIRKVPHSLTFSVQFIQRIFLS